MPFEYDAIYPYNDNLALAYKDDKCGFLNLQGEIEIPFDYELCNQFKNGKVVVVKPFGKGVIDTLNNIVIPFKYNALATHNHDFYRYQLNNDKFGIMDSNEQVVLEPIYDQLDAKNDSLWIGKINGKFIILKNDGTFHNEGPFDKIGRIYKSIDSGHFIWFIENGKRGLFNESYQTIIPPIYERSSVNIGSIVSVHNGQKWGFINKENIHVTNFIYDEVGFLNKEKCIVVKDRKYNLLDQNGSEILNEYCDDIQKISGSELIFMDNHIYNSQLAMITKHTVRLSTSRFSGMNHGMMKIYVNNKLGFLDSLGNLAIQGIYDEGDHFYKEKCTAVKLNGTWDFISSEGEDITTMKFDSVHHFGSFNECNYIVVKDGKKGCFFKGKLLYQPQFDKLYVDLELGLIYKTGNKYGSINLMNGNIIENLDIAKRMKE